MNSSIGDAQDNILLDRHSRLRHWQRHTPFSGFQSIARTREYVALA